MKVFSYNFKGIPNPSKGKKIKYWLKQQGAFDAIAFVDIKCAGEDLL